MADTPTSPSARDLVVQRSYAAPVELVWRAWTEAEHIMRWWGPDYFTCPVCKLDLREGGSALLCMRSPQGDDYYSLLKYIKIVPHELIEYVHNLCDAQGNVIEPASVGLPPDFPQNVRTLVSFRAAGESTELTVREADLPDTPMRKPAEMGWAQSLGKLATSLGAA